MSSNPSGRWFPTVNQVNDPDSTERSFRQTLTQQYALEDQLSGINKQIKNPTPEQTNSGPANTKLLGLNVTPIDTSQTPYGSAPVFIPGTQQITFMQTFVVVPAPATAASPGVPNQVAWDSTHFYVCIAVNSWVRCNLASW